MISLSASAFDGSKVERKYPTSSATPSLPATVGRHMETSNFD
ncbi:hypothetical protein ACHAXS_008853, partial [Conticribra weissflogii]